MCCGFFFQAEDGIRDRDVTGVQTCAFRSHGQFLASSVTNKLARLLFDVSGGTGRFINGPTFLRALSIADLFQRLVALPDGLIKGLLFESDLARFLKVLLADLLLSGGELCDVGVVALFDIFMGAFQDGVFLDGLDGLLLLDTAKASLGVVHAAAEVDSSLDLGSGLLGLLAALTVAASAQPTAATSLADEVGGGKGQQGH